MDTGNLVPSHLLLDYNALYSKAITMSRAYLEVSVLVRPAQPNGTITAIHGGTKLNPMQLPASKTGRGIGRTLRI